MADDATMTALGKVLETYKVGGDFSTQRASQLKGTERKYTAGAKAGLVSRGLSGTTIASSIPAAFEQEVAAPYRTETERLRSGSEMQGLIAKAGFLQADEERSLREKLADAERGSRENIAGDQLGMQFYQASQAAEAARLERKAAARIGSDSKAGSGGGSGGGGSGSSSGSGFMQHVGGSGSLDLGINYGAGGGTPGGGGGGTASVTSSEYTGGWSGDALGMDPAMMGLMSGDALGMDPAMMGLMSGDALGMDPAMMGLMSGGALGMDPAMMGAGSTSAKYPLWDERAGKAYQRGGMGQRFYSDGSHKA